MNGMHNTLHAFHWTVNPQPTNLFAADVRKCVLAARRIALYDRPVEVHLMGSMPMVQEAVDLLLTAEEVALKLKVSKDWVWDHSSRRLPYLPVIRMSDGALRYRASGIEEFLRERERASTFRRKRR